MTAVRTRALELLHASLGHEDAEFHEHQWEAVSALVENRGRLLVVQRTGWGKSAVYFIATRLMREQGYGPTVIISPLLALMRNQIDSALTYGVRLGTINSSNSAEINRQTAGALLNNQLDAIIISPEQLSKPDFVDRVLMPISDTVGLFVIDEAHCISDWGHDFRPDYKRIISILRFLPVNMPVLATTATANQRVMKDISSQLGEHPTVFRGQLTRESIHLQNIGFPRRSQRLAWLADVLPTLEGTGIIYVSTTRDAEVVADWLKSRGIAAEAYYGSFKNMSNEESQARRLALEDDLLNNRIKALVATSALGMGYDKPDLAFVIHFQSPGSVVSYYQQVGRAGRGIPKAYGVLLSGNEDDDIQQFFINNAFPTERLVTEILNVLDESEEGLTKSQIQQQVNGRPSKIDAALKFLGAESPAPIVVSQSPIRYSRTVNDYALPREKIERILAIKRQEWTTMQEYLSHTGCLMKFLANDLDDVDSETCGRCANCLPESKLTEAYTHETGVDASAFLKNQAIEIAPKKRVGTRAEVAARFPEYRFPPSFGVLEHKPGRALCHWGDAGWGEIAKIGKRSGAFHAGLVQASADYIRDCWGPEPYPTWVTCVPSQRHPKLVPGFANDLASALGLPCIEAVINVRANQAQKGMENSHHRCRNLDGVFSVESVIEGEPVFLIDDAVDSGWTFAVIAALLRQAGSGPVYPFAIMSTATSS
jgi:ATP-dependent DNA helicase RecQ